VLDEPTAALDPIAEYEVYTTFDKTIGNKTAVFISHRLSSCRFCQRIVVFDEGSLIQLGTHESLLEDKSSRYHELWEAQASHYRDE
jgi:ATP-binding cassette subfamily B protein